MQKPKSQRHVKAAKARWRAAEARAEAERQDGIADRVDADFRQPFTLDLRSAGGPHLHIEPRRGYVSWRAVDMGTGCVTHCAALKELLHHIADDLPRMLAPRNYE